MQVYFFTRTGKSQSIAQKIASHFETQALKIDDGKDWSGAVNYVKGGALASKGTVLDVNFQEPSESDDIILVFPLWASTSPPGIKGFIEKVDPKRITAVVVSAATSLKANEKEMFKNVYEVKGKDENPPSELLKM